MSIMPVLGRWRQADSWSSLPSQTDQLVRLSNRPCLKTEGGKQLRTMTGVYLCLLHGCAHTCMNMYACVQHTENTQIKLKDLNLRLLQLQRPCWSTLCSPPSSHHLRSIHSYGASWDQQACHGEASFLREITPRPLFFFSMRVEKKLASSNFRNTALLFFLIDQPVTLRY